MRAWAFDPAAGTVEPASGIIPAPTAWWVTPQTLAALNAALPEEDQDIRRISCWPIERTFAYLDVSDFSKHRPGQEGLIINSLVYLVSNEALWTGQGARVYQGYEAMLCIGDGYIFVFEEPLAGTYFAAYLAQLIEALVARQMLPVAFHFRIGVHTGPVYSFWDPGRKGWNYIGDGINGGQRVLAAVGKDTDDVMFISGQVRHALMANTEQHVIAPPILSALQNRGRRADKHGNPWRVYELNHTALCADELPPNLQS